MRQQIFQFSAIAAFLSGGTLALIPLDSIAENLLGVAVAFIAVNVAGFLLKPVCEALRTAETKRRLKVALSQRNENTPN
jgi:hypothetical protein